MSEIHFSNSATEWNSQRYQKKLFCFFVVLVMQTRLVSLSMAFCFWFKLLCQCRAVFCYKQNELVVASAYNSKVNVHITNLGGCYFGGSCFKRLQCMTVKTQDFRFQIFPCNDISAGCYFDEIERRDKYTGSKKVTKQIKCT